MKTSTARSAGVRIFSAAAALLFAGAAASAQVLYVDGAAPAGGSGSSWSAAFNDLQAALSAARSNVSVREIRVAQGVYKPGPVGDRGVSFDLVERVAVKGGYAGLAGADPDLRDLRHTPTVLSGDLQGNDVSGAGRGIRYDNVFHVVRAVGLLYPAVLDGVHITGGYGDGDGNDGRGGGIYVDQCGENLTVSRCTLRDNYAQFGGAAMVYDSAGVFSQCVVVGNRASFRPGFDVSGFRLGLTPLIDGCTVAMNTSAFPYAGAGIVSQAVRANPDPEGPPTVAARITVRSSIVFGNTSTGAVWLPQQFGGFYEATSCLSSEAEGWQGGVRGNITGDPRFVGGAGADGVAGTLDDDFRLMPGSPAIDAGAGSPVDSADVDGDGVLDEPASQDADGLARSYGARPDVGAFEGPVLSVVTTGSTLTIEEGSTRTYLVRLTRDPGSNVTVSGAAAPVGGTGLVMTPSSVVLGSGNWEAGVEVTLSWPTDADLTDDATTLMLTGAGMPAAEQAVVQVDHTTPPSVLYVNPGATLPADGASWASGYRTIEDGLAVAAAFPQIQQVWVRAGTYQPPLPAGQSDQRLRRYVMRSGLRLVGGFAGTESSASQRDLSLNRTVITGDNLGNDAPAFTNYGDNCDSLLQVNGAATGTLIDGVDFLRSTTAAVFVEPSSPDIDNLSVRNCRFAFNRGLGLKRIAAQGVSEVSSCVFEDNGGVAYESRALSVSMYGNGNPTQRLDVTDCVFRRNGGGPGCAVRFEGERINLTGCTFDRNTSSGAWTRSLGAAASMVMYGAATNTVMAAVSDCAFTGNSGDANGGGLAVAYTGPGDPVRVVSRVTGCEFAANHANSGGGMYASSPSANRVEVTNCAFTGNSASVAGGATGGSYFNCEFRQNTAAQGGAGPGVAEGCVFDGNTATVEGGACQNGERYTRCTFTNNSAPRSGAMAYIQRIDSCLFSGNHATAGDGGAIGQCTSAVNCVFVGNTATGSGGAGRVFDSIGCRFAGNSAGGNGGAVIDALRSVNSLFTGNTAGGTGGAVYGIWNVIGCTVYGNHATSVGGVDAVNLSTSDTQTRHAVNSIFWNNTASTGTVEQKQLRFALGASDPISDTMGSARGESPGAQSFELVCTQGPMVGGFVAPFSAALLTQGPTPPYLRPTVAPAPSGGLAGLSPVFGPAETWVGLPANGSGDVPSTLMQTGLGTSPQLFTSAQWRVTFLVDGQLGDAVNPGLFIGATAMPNSTGGSPGVQTNWTFDASDAVRMGAPSWASFYVRNDSGFGGLCLRSVITYFHPPVSWCIIQGLNAHTGNANLGQDPGLDLIEGPDGELGTADDDATPGLASPAVDSGNSRVVARDQYDADGDGVTTQEFLTDLLGDARVAECPVDNGGVGWRGQMDRGAVEAPPFQPLMAPPCLADIGSAGGVFGRDGQLDNNDFVVFIDAFFAESVVADVGGVGGVAGGDGAWDNNDFVVFIDLFFSGC